MPHNTALGEHVFLI